MKKLLIIVMACYGLNARAQVDGSRDFVYLFSDSIVYAKKVRLNPDLSGGWQVRADSRRILNDRIKFFNNDDGFFANTRQMNPLRISSFSERIIEGRINLYQQTEYEPLGYGRRHRYVRNTPQNVDHRMFYNKNYTDLKRVNYQNLRQDMADHPESIDLLNRYRRSVNTKKAMYTAAALSIVGSFISILTEAGKNDIIGGGMGVHPTIRKSNFNPSIILFSLGAGLGLGGYGVDVSGQRKLEDVVEAYNR